MLDLLACGRTAPCGVFAELIAEERLEGAASCYLNGSEKAVEKIKSGPWAWMGRGEVKERAQKKIK